MSPHDAAAQAAFLLGPIQRDGSGELVFREPWEAQAFALAVALHERGLFTWPEWAAALSAEIRRAPAAAVPGDGSIDYRHWLAALEDLVSAKGAASAELLAARRAAWARAARATPHGQPILLANDPLGSP